MPEADAGPLPYRDTKAMGAADFYFGINATFRYILGKFGQAGLERYWREMGVRYFAPVSRKWQQGGLAGVAEYWRAFFAAEPGSEVRVTQEEGAVRVEVQTCPAIRHLRAHGREIVPCFCQHCYFVSEAIAEPAGMTVRVLGGNGACTQRFTLRVATTEPQRLSDIVEATGA